mmetsp:Transcript_19232/g.36539  ORF Transcript_19232/g.36539 Transcript_19232/m.36539 type:complete len:90 (+) Transcript_19232:103-372(+)
MPNKTHKIFRVIMIRRVAKSSVIQCVSRISFQHTAKSFAYSANFVKVECNLSKSSGFTCSMKWATPPVASSVAPNLTNVVTPFAALFST